MLDTLDTLYKHRFITEYEYRNYLTNLKKEFDKKEKTHIPIWKLENSPANNRRVIMIIKLSPKMTISRKKERVSYHVHTHM